jgi:hypothetical protein
MCGESIAVKANNPDLWVKGNNAEPLARGQCCDFCNAFVVAARLAGVLNNG